MISSVGSQNFATINKILQKSSKKNETNKTSEVLANDRLQELSKQIENGDYKFELNQTANAVAKELIG